jgi:hypothetical protein
VYIISSERVRDRGVPASSEAKEERFRWRPS